MQKSKEMPMYGTNIPDQLKKWRERISELEEWHDTNDTDHPEWEQKFRDLNTAKLKVDQLRDRKNRVPKKLGQIYSLPNV